MTIHRFDTDTQSHQLLQPSMVQIYPRRTRYGDADAAGVPVEGIPDALVAKDAFKETIARCHELKIFPQYHQYASWCPVGSRWNQDGLGYCWTWSGTGAVMDVRGIEGKPTVQLAPVSMGYLVKWQNKGNYLESFIKGAQEQGIAPADYVSNQHAPSPQSFKVGWDTERAKYRLSAVWDTNARDGDTTMIQHCLSILAYGRPLQIALSWWGHALSLVAMRWDESVVNNIVWVIRNSHNEDDVIELTGSKGVPDEAYGFISTELTE